MSRQRHMHICTLTHMHACVYTHISLAKSTPPPTLLCTPTHKHILSSAYPTILTPQKHSSTNSKLVIKNKQKHTISTPTLPHSLRLCPLPTCSAPPPNSHKHQHTLTHTLTPFHSKLILLSKQAPSSRQRQWVPFSVSSEKRETLLFTDEWSLLMKRRALFTATPFIYRPVFQVVIEGHSTKHPPPPPHPPHPINLTHLPPSISSS